MVKQLKKFWVDITICSVAAIAYYFSAQAELFEKLYDFSRSHEDWELDELILVYMIGAIALPVLLLLSKSRLKRAMKAVTVAEEKAQHAARHDPLTGLHNRRYFSELLERSIDQATPDDIPVVLLLDLDRFKAINDLRGHDVGDRVLREVSARVNDCCRDFGTAARLGGDEFAILLNDTEEFERSISLARRLLTAIAEPIYLDGWRVTVGASIGVCGWSIGDDSAALVRNADQAMYKAKEESRNGYAFFNEVLGDELKRQALLEEELKIAVSARDIEPYFQPIVDITSGEVSGFEVLSRWSSPTFGPVAPDVFIAIAEDMGLIETITWQVMRKSLKVASEWDEGFFLAFNLSPHLFNDELVKNITWHLNEADFDAHRLEIEITENAVIDNIDEAKQALDALKELGIRISLDDFGTGFSSLATLSRLPFDKIKIDKSFVTELDSPSQNAKIVSAILALAKSLGINVTAEGIETEEELGFLHQSACLHGQGYLFSKPMNEAEISKFLTEIEGLEPNKAAG